MPVRQLVELRNFCVFYHFLCLIFLEIVCSCCLILQLFSVWRLRHVVTWSCCSFHHVAWSPCYHAIFYLHCCIVPVNSSGQHSITTSMVMFPIYNVYLKIIWLCSQHIMYIWKSTKCSPTRNFSCCTRMGLFERLPGALGVPLSGLRGTHLGTYLCLSGALWVPPLGLRGLPNGRLCQPRNLGASLDFSWGTSSSVKEVLFEAFLWLIWKESCLSVVLLTKL